MSRFPGRRIGLLAIVLLALGGWPKAAAQSYEWTTIAGSMGGMGFRDGPLGIASFRSPRAVAGDAAGNLYLADSGNHTIRKITPEGRVSTLAGKGGAAGSVDGFGAAARFNNPGGIAVAGDGTLYIADTGNHTVRKLSPDGTVITLAGEAGISGHADGAGSAAHFFAPAAIALAPNGGLFVADSANHLIRRISPDGSVATVAGQAGVAGASDGGPGVAHFDTPQALVSDDTGTLYIADSNNCIIRKITPDGMVATLAGLAGAYDHVDGIGRAARFCTPDGIAVDAARNVYVADFDAGTIRKIAAADGMVTTLAGNINAAAPGRIDGTGVEALFFQPRGMALASDGSLVVVDTGNQALRKVTADVGAVTTLAANPPAESGAVDAVGTSARLRSPLDLTCDGSGTLYIADTGNRTIRVISPSGVLTTLAGTAGLSGDSDATGPAARFKSPRAVALGPDGTLYVADVVSSTDSTIRKISPAGAVTTLAGTPGTLAPADTLYFLTGLAVDASGNVFASDISSIRKITAQGAVSVFAGRKRGWTAFPGGGGFRSWKIATIDGVGDLACFNKPSAVAIDGSGNLYVTEAAGCVIRKVTANADATTLAGLSGDIDGVHGAMPSAPSIPTASRFHWKNC